MVLMQRGGSSMKKAAGKKVSGLVAAMVLLGGAG
jgi:hypothetical protein